MNVSRSPSDRSPTGHFFRQLRRSDRAATLAFAAVGAGVLLGCAALAVDLGMLMTARVHSQRAADSGALAGAQRLAMPGATAPDARKEAQEFANSHNVLSSPVAVKNTDVDVDGDTVRVRVHHTVGTVFARIFGVDEMNVSTVAAAEAVPAGGASCPLPIIIADGYTDLDNDGLYDDGEPYTQCTGPDTHCTGFNLYTDDPENDIGALLEVKSQNNAEPEGALDPKEKTCAAENPEWYCWVDAISGVGVGSSELEDVINGCQNTTFEIAIGDVAESSSGNKMSTVQEVKTYIDNNDSNHRWSPSDRCVVDGTGKCVGSSKRIRPIAVADPTTITSSGNNAHADVNNMVSVFIEKVASDFDKAHGQDPPPGQWNIYLRLLGAAQGGTAGQGIEGAEGSLLQRIVLIE